MGIWESVGILGLVMGLLVSSRVRIDLVGMIALALVGVLQLVPTHDLFSGFSSYAAIILAEMFILGEGLRRSGATDYMAQMFERIGKKGEGPLVTALMALPPVPSTFISDVGLMSIFLPTMVRIRQRLHVSLHRLLMPLVISIALGGLLSMIGSAGNIIGNSTLASGHYAPIPLFGITPLGAVLVIAGFVYMKLWGIHRLPGDKDSGEFLSNYEQVKNFISEVRVTDKSDLIGKQLQQVDFFRENQLTIIRIIRATGEVPNPGPYDILHADDRVIVQGDVESMMALTSSQGVQVSGGENPIRLRSAKVRVVEAMLPQRSVFVRHTLRELDFRVRYGATVLAILRQGVTHHKALPDIRLQGGDVLLVMGNEDAISRLKLGDDLLVFADIERTNVHSPKNSILAIGVVLGVLLVAALSFLAIQVAAAAAIVIFILTGILTLENVYRAIDWRIITLVGGMTPLSIALTRSGVTTTVAHALIHALGVWGPYAMLAVFFWLAALLTQVISNVAAALVLAPLALSVAGANHWSPDPFIIAMVVALSASPITPLANKVFIMAMGPGQYAYNDFFRIGLPLTVIMFILTIVMTPWLFPFAVS